MQGHRKGHFLFLLQTMFFFLGLVALGYWTYVVVETRAVQAYEHWAFEQELTGRKPSLPGYLGSLVTGKPEPSVETPEPEPKTAPDASPGPRPQRPNKAWLGRIEIERVKVSSVVHRGVDSRTLRRAVGHIPGTSLPGQPGNVGLAAHRDTFFRGLRNIRRKDLIRVETLDGVFEYQVESMQIVTPDRVDVLEASAEPSLTLVTCHPFEFIGKAPNRFIVKARLITPAILPSRGS